MSSTGLHISTVMEWLARELENPGGQFAEFAAAYARAKRRELYEETGLHGTAEKLGIPSPKD